MGTHTRSSSTPSIPTAHRDARHRAAVALLRRAGEQARLLRQQRAPFEPESAGDAARNRAMVAADANASAWRFGQARQPDDEPPAEMTPEQAAAFALGREIARRRQQARS